MRVLRGLRKVEDLLKKLNSLCTSHKIRRTQQLLLTFECASFYKWRPHEHRSHLDVFVNARR
jgi:hypothetical protein